ncbi:MAG: DoxX family protein [Sulfuriferula sp.]
MFGRLLIAQIFLIAGFDKLGHFAQTAGYMSSLGLPMTNILLTLTIVIEICLVATSMDLHGFKPEDMMPGIPAMSVAAALPYLEAAKKLLSF